MQSYLDTFASRRVALVGDLMLDCYMNGTVNRISPEAPVPVLHVTGQRAVAGGAANVAANLASLGVHVRVVGVVGRDDSREQLITALATSGDVDCSGIVTASDRQTIRKLRIVGEHQQIVRVDQEDKTALSPALEAECIAAARAAIDEADVLVVSDYGKGVCSDAVLAAVLCHARAGGKPVLVDPKRIDLAAYRGATIITPNRKELAEATRLPCETDAEAEAAARAAQTMSGATILLTRSEKGMSLFPLDAPAVHFPTLAQEVFDVSGAGDTVVAVLAASMAADVPMLDGIRMANHAGGIVVSKLGTASVTRAELHASLAAERASPAVDDGRLLDRDGAVAQRWAWARDKLTVGVANGCFDLLHPGHVSLIAQAAAHCDRLIMALNSDASVRRLKGSSRPVQDETARAAVMGAIKGVSAVVIFDEDTPLELIEALQPDVLVKGSDYTEDRVVGGEVVRARGGRVVLADLSPGHSTSRLVAAAASPA
jgi:D-beta-D-heptose 7-phosphate kinase / D-beta-D-heptose 1-phosphate adenosyltransferase